MFGRAGNTRSANLLNQKRLNARSLTIDNKMRHLYSSQAVNHYQNLYFECTRRWPNFGLRLGQRFTFSFNLNTRLSMFNNNKSIIESTPIPTNVRIKMVFSNRFTQIS